jgi:hypothetical protein
VNGLNFLSFTKVVAMKLAGQDDVTGARRHLAWLDADSSVPPTPCYVEEVSSAGARLKVFRPAVPNEFTLHFNRRGDAKVRCRVTSQVGANCAVEFVASLAIYS